MKNGYGKVIVIAIVLTVLAIIGAIFMNTKHKETNNVNTIEIHRIENDKNNNTYETTEEDDGSINKYNFHYVEDEPVEEIEVNIEENEPNLDTENDNSSDTEERTVIIDGKEYKIYE